VLVYFHGGGWTIGDLDTHDVLCRQLVRPAAARCCRWTTAWGRSTASLRRWKTAWPPCAGCAAGRSHGLDASRIALGGDSAGGNLAAVVAIAMRDAGDPVKRCCSC
jgi:acetyl esterase